MHEACDIDLYEVYNLSKKSRHNDKNIDYIFVQN